MTTGWICLHRGLLDWEWYNDINVTRLFIHCLIRANHKPKKWRGISIDRGQFWTSISTLTKETGLSASKIKTAFSKLEMTGEIANKSQAGGRMVTIVKYDSYQDNSQQASQQVASQSPTSSQPIATNNNDNNENNENNENNKSKKPPASKQDLDWGDIPLSEQQKEDVKGIRLAAKAKLTQRALNTIIKELDKAAMAGIAYEESIDIWALRSWKGFNAQWAIEHKGAGQQNQVLNRQDSKRANSVNNLINMFEPREVIDNGQPKQLPTNNA